MTKIFISYRREDSQWPADQIYRAIKPRVVDPKKDVFIDVDNIPLGVNFADHLDASVAQCDVMLALIGPAWLEVKNPKTGARRLDDPEDFVRIEIGSALKRGKRVVLILLDGAQIPPASDLPDELKPLSLCNGVEVRRLSFETDTEQLFERLGLRARSRGWRFFPVAAASAVLTAALAVWLLFFNVGPPPTAEEVSNAVYTLDEKKFAAFLKTSWDPNMRIDADDNTALHNLMSVCEKNPAHDATRLAKIAAMLVDGGADPNLENKWHDTPRFLAGVSRYCGPNSLVATVLN